MTNNLPNFDSSEKEIMRDFEFRIAQMGADEEILNGETPEDTAPLDEIPGAEGPEGGDDQAGDDLEDMLDSPDKQKIEVLPWDKVTIEMNEDYANMLMREQGLDQADALDKAHYIRYKTPEELLALQGTIMGQDSADGEGLIEVGGYDREENLTKQMKRLKGEKPDDPNAIYPGGIPESIKDEILVPLDELSSSFEEYKDSKDEDKAERKIEELENPVEPEKDLESEEDENLDMPPVEETAPVATEQAPKGGKMSPTIPKPVGKAFLNTENRITKRSGRLDRLNSIK